MSETRFGYEPPEAQAEQRRFDSRATVIRLLREAEEELMNNIETYEAPEPGDESVRVEDLDSLRKTLRAVTRAFKHLSDPAVRPADLRNDAEAWDVLGRYLRADQEARTAFEYLTSE